MFVEKDHDWIFHRTGQSQTYEAISVQLFAKMTDSGECNILDVIEGGQILRVACAEENDGRTEAAPSHRVREDTGIYSCA